MIEGREYHVGIDTAAGESLAIERHYMPPDADYPLGSYMEMIAGEVTVATGRYATLYPNKPSYCWHGGAPFVFLDTTDWDWSKQNIHPGQDALLLDSGRDK
jgi:hypothetical protein